MIRAHHGKHPVVPDSVFIAESADLIGDVELGSESSVWFQAVLRGDIHSIRIGHRTNIQDHCLIHVSRPGSGSEAGSPVVIGDDVTVGHRAILHGCRIGSRVLIGMGAIIMDDADIGDDCMIGAGALVTRGDRVPDGSLFLGFPGKVKRSITPEERQYLRKSAANYVRDAFSYRPWTVARTREETP